MKKGFSSLPKSRKAIVIALFAFILFYCSVLLFLYIWGFFTSLKSLAGFIRDMFGFPTGWPWEWAWDNYVTVFNVMRLTVTRNGERVTVYLLDMLWNSFLFAALNAVLTTFYTWLTAYLIARFDHYFWSKFIFSFNLIMMFIPIAGNLASSLQIYKMLGIYNTWWYVIYNAIGFGGMRLLIFHTFLKGLGKEYTEAAVIDGAGNNTIAFKIMLPLSWPLMVSIGIMIFMGAWNNYMTMVIWMPSYPTLAYGIWRFSSVDTTKLSWPPLQIAACMILVVPVLALYLCFQKTIMENMRVGGLK